MASSGKNYIYKYSECYSQTNFVSCNLVVKGAGTPPTRPAHAKPIKVAMED